MSLAEQTSDYSTHGYQHSEYKMLKVAPISNGPVNLANTSTIETPIDVPNEVYNLSRSYLTFTLTVPPTANTYINFYNNFASVLKSLAFTQQGGTPLANIDFLQNWLSIAAMYDTKFEDLLNKDKIEPQYLANSLAQANQWVQARTDNGGAGNQAAFFTQSSQNFREPKYMMQSPLMAAANWVLNLRLPFSKFQDTLLSVDKNLHFGKIMQIRPLWSETQKYMYTTPSAMDIVTGAANVSGVPTVSNLYLWLAVEQNIRMAEHTRNLFNSGKLVMQVPYVWSYRQPYNATIQQNYNVRLDGSNGQSLRKIVYAVFNNNETLASAYDHSNLDSSVWPPVYGTKINSYNSYIDSIRLEDDIVDCTRSANSYHDDYKLVKDIGLLRGTPILNYDMFQQNEVIVKDFTGLKPGHPLAVGNANISAGLPLVDQPRQFSIQLKTPGVLPSGLAGTGIQAVHYMFAVCQRTLSCRPNDIQIV